MQLGNTCHQGSPSHAAWLSCAYVLASSQGALPQHRPHLRVNSLSSLLPQFPFQFLPLLKLRKEQEFIVAQCSTELQEANGSLLSFQVRSSVIPNVSFIHIKTQSSLKCKFYLFNKYGIKLSGFLYNSLCRTDILSNCPMLAIRQNEMHSCKPPCIPQSFQMLAGTIPPPAARHYGFLHL